VPQPFNLFVRGNSTTNTTRRNFLRTSAAALTGLTSSMRGVLAETLAVPANNAAGSIKDVEHVVILMLENRSFEHYFGTMQGVRGFGDRFPVPLASGKQVWFESDSTREVPPFHFDMKRMNALNVDTTSHEFADTQAASASGPSSRLT
jgi:phospholipase C